MGKIYVGNCSFDVTEQQLRDVFGTYGEVSSVNVITDRTGRPRGFAFVEMSDSSAAEAAIRGVNGTESRWSYIERQRSQTPDRRRRWRRAALVSPTPRLGPDFCLRRARDL